MKCVYLARLNASSINWPRLISGIPQEEARSHCQEGVKLQFSAGCENNSYKLNNTFCSKVDNKHTHLMITLQLIDKSVPVLVIIVHSIITARVYIDQQPSIISDFKNRLSHCRVNMFVGISTMSVLVLYQNLSIFFSYPKHSLNISLAVLVAEE